jgi:hypothetical protein
MTTTENQADERLRLRRLRARLKRATTKLEEFEHRLQALHADRSGAFRQMYPRTPLIPSEWYVASRSLRRNVSDAAKGCPLCIAWLEQTAVLRARIDTLHNTQLPEKAPDYDGPWVFPEFAMRAGKKRRRASPLRTHEELQQIAAEYVARVQARHERRGN